MRKKLLVFILILTMMAGMLPMHAEVRADEGADPARIEKSIDSVIKAVDNLEEIINPEQASTIAAIFSGFVSTCSTVGTIVSSINGTVTFLKLIGLVKDSNAAALADISQQVTAINERISQMDAKLDVITEQMQVIHATDQFNDRAIKASQMISAWHSFEANYMEDKMDELMRQYNVMLTDGMKTWLENKTEDARHQGSVETDRVILWYKCTNAEDEFVVDHWQPEFELQVTVANQFSDQASTDVAVPDPYTIYSDQFNEKYDRYMILNDTFFPAAGEMAWDVNTYRENVKSYIGNEITEALNASDPRIKTWNMYDLTVEQIDELADLAVDQIAFRISYNALNNSSDFASKVVKQFGEYCDHLVSAQQGLDAMMKTMYLTHAFEFEIADDLRMFMDEMSLKTGVYGLFAVNVAGISNSVSTADRQNVLDQMCTALDRITASRDHGLTGYDAYCYTTGTVLQYAEIVLKAAADTEWRHRGSYKAYRSCTGKGISVSFNYDGDSVPTTGSLIGDSHAVLLTYVLNSNGESLSHDYMNQHLTGTAREYHGPLVTTVNGETQMLADTNMKLKTENIIGGYFDGDPTIYLNSLPGSAGFGYMAYRRMMTGTLYDPEAIKLSVNAPLTGIGVYGENHDYWVVDEAAVMGGPADLGSFAHESSIEHTDVDVLGNHYYTTHYNQSVTYNCLISLPVITPGQNTGEGFDPLEDLQKFVDGDAPDEHVHEWDEGVVTQEPQGDTPGVITYTCLLDPSHIRTELYPQPETVTLTFDPAGGVFRGSEEPVSMEFEKGAEIMLPGAPEKEGYAFLYWTSEEYPVDQAYTVTEEQTFTAVYEEVSPPEITDVGMSSDGAVLTWESLPGAEQYEIVRTDAAGGSEVYTAAEASYTDDTVKSGETYLYKVRAYVSGSWSGYGGEKKVVFNPFTDIPSAGKTFKYVSWAFNEGIVSGTTKTDFSPKDSCRRDQFIMMFWKMNGSPAAEGVENPFSDIKDGTKTCKAVLWALQEGIITSGKKFNPKGNISRAQIVMILWKMSGSPKAEGTCPFSDVTGKKTINAVTWAYNNKVVKGTGATAFSPDDNCTRLQLVTLLYKFSKLS